MPHGAADAGQPPQRPRLSDEHWQTGHVPVLWIALLAPLALLVLMLSMERVENRLVDGEPAEAAGAPQA